MSSPTSRSGLLSKYDSGEYFCELLGSPASPHPVFETIEQQLSTITEDELRSRAVAAENDLFDLGVTFTVYSEKNAIDRVLPFDLAAARILAAYRVPEQAPLDDALIAAVAQAAQMAVVTRNTRHFEPLGVPCLNPWDSTPPPPR